MAIPSPEIHNIVIRVDASPTVGGGHAMRCLALADALAERGAEVVFACRDGSVETVPALASGSHQIFTLACDAGDEPAALKVRFQDGCDLLIVDHYQRDAVFERACRPWARRIMALDDLADRPHDCDMLLDPCPGRGVDSYAGLVPVHCSMFLGPSYAPLRPEFADARRNSIARRSEAAAGIDRIVVSLGLSDPHDMTSRVLEEIRDAGSSAAVDVILGPGAPNLSRVKELAKRLPGGGEIHVDPKSVAGLLARADLAVGAAGGSAWERCCLGLPTLMIVTADNQRANAASLSQAGAARLLGEAEHLDAGTIAKQLRELTADPHDLADMSRRAAALCDGRGVERMVQRIEETRAVQKTRPLLENILRQ